MSDPSANEGTPRSRPWSARAARIVARLAFQRALPLPLLAVGLALVVLGLVSGASPEQDAAPFPIDEGLARMWARARLWTLAGGFAALVCALGGAQVGSLSRSRRGDFLGAAPLPRWVLVVSAWAGVTLAGLVPLTAGLAAAEVAAGGSGPADEQLAALETPTLRLFDDLALRFALADSLPSGLQLEDPAVALALELVSLPRARPAARLALGLEDGRGRRPPQSQRVLGRARARLALDGEVPDAVWIEREAEGAGVVVPSGTVRILRGAPRGERSAGLRLWAAGALALGVLAAFGIGLGCWLHPSIATLGVGALALLPVALDTLFAGALDAALPGTRLLPLLVGEVPNQLSLRELALGLILVATGLALALPRRLRRFAP